MPENFFKHHNVHDRDSMPKYFWKFIFKSISENHLKIPNLTVTWAWVKMQSLIFRIFSTTVQEVDARVMNYAELWQKQRPVPFQDTMQKIFEGRNKGLWQSQKKINVNFRVRKKPHRINLEQEQSSVFSFVTLWDCEIKI